MADANVNSNAPENAPSPDQIETAGVQVTERDIVFDCPHCGGELVVDMDGAGIGSQLHALRWRAKGP